MKNKGIKHTSRQIPTLRIALPKPILQQSPRRTRLRMTLLVQLVQIIGIDIFFEFAPEDNYVESGFGPFYTFTFNECA